MLEMGDQLLPLIFNAFHFTEADRKLLMSEAAMEHLVIFAVSLAAFNQLALVLRLNFHSLTSVIICDCSVFLRVMMFMSLLGIFVQDKLPWITHAPLIFLPLLLLRALVRLRTAAGGDVDGGRALAAARREMSDAMLAKTEQILKPVVAAFLATEEGRQLLLSEAAAPYLIVFVLSIAGFKFLAHIRGHDFTPFVSADFIHDCCAFLKVTIIMSLTGTFMHSKLPWITHTPLLFLLLVLLRALVHIYKSSTDCRFSEEPRHQGEERVLTLHVSTSSPENRPSCRAPLPSDDDCRRLVLRVHEDIQRISSSELQD